jgi:hypothetical protein
MMKFDQSTANVKLPLSSTPDHLRVDRAEMDRRIAERLARGILDASKQAPPIRDLEQYLSTLDHSRKGTAAAPQAVEPTTVSADTPYPEERWQDREASDQRVQNDRMVDEYLEQVSSGPTCRETTERTQEGLVSRKPHSFIRAAAAVAAKIQKYIPRSPEKQRAIELRRMIGGNQGLPPWIRKMLTQGQQAVALVMFEQDRRFQKCELCNANIAAMAGVGRTIVAETKAILKAAGEISCKERRLSQARSLPTVVKIVSARLLDWIRKGPVGGWFQKSDNNKSQNRFYLRPCPNEVDKSRGVVDNYPDSDASLCLDST